MRLSAASRLGLGAVVAAGFVTCAAAWWRAGGHARLEDQTGSVWLGVAGLALAVAGEATGLGLDRRALRRYRARLVDDASSLIARRAWSGPEAGSGAFVAAPGMQRYHRRSCPIAAGAPGTIASRTEHEAGGREPCGICCP